MGRQAEIWKTRANTVLDMRPELESGGEPFVQIMQAAADIKPGGALVIIAPFEPLPLYEVLGECGFMRETEKVVADEWVACFSHST